MSSLPVAPRTEKRQLIDEWLPDRDVAARYAVVVNAPASVVYQQLLACDFNSISIVRFLMTLRTGRRAPRAPENLRRCLEGTGFILLAEVPGEELVIGVGGKFWRPDGMRCFDLNPGDFSEFSRRGYAKAVWNFHLAPEAQGRTILSTETRIKCFGRSARWKFRLYWILVGPFSGVIRKAILRKIKTDSESAALTPAKLPC